jgi:hypothetical protein
MGNHNYFDIISILSGILWLAIIIIFISWIYAVKIKEEANNRLFIPTIIFKIISALGFSFIYLFYYQGGDTFAYWDGATALNNLLLESPADYLWEMLNPSNAINQRLHFNSITGYPPSWIYKEPESFFVSKMLSVLAFITFNSYWATTILLATIGGGISWYFFQIIRKLRLHKDSILAFGLLFLPSVSFWCFGISKDTFVYLAFILLCSNIVLLFLLGEKLIFSRLLIIIICTFLIYNTRIYVLVAMFPALVIAFSTHIGQKNRQNKIKKFSLKALFYLISATFLTLYIQFSSGVADFERTLANLFVIQQDFSQNTTYGLLRYTIFLEDSSAQSIILSIPSAVLAAIYRPYPWEALNPVLLLNGIESLIFVLLTIQFLSKSSKEKIKIISQSELLTFSLVFIIILGFSVGFTSGLFGVLVRFKAPILPFFILLIGISTNVKKEQGNKELS